MADDDMKWFSDLVDRRFDETRAMLPRAELDYTSFGHGFLAALVEVARGGLPHIELNASTARLEAMIAKTGAGGRAR